ncbi:MAG: hypothetical protein ABIP48_01970, partial [Planctomycetota bacterium]
MNTRCVWSLFCLFSALPAAWSSEPRVDDIFTKKKIVEVMRAWGGLVRHVHPDGKLGFVQPVGASPKPATPEMTHEYAMGLLLLAGEEMVKLVEMPLSDRFKRLKAPFEPELLQQPKPFSTPGHLHGDLEDFRSEFNVGGRNVYRYRQPPLGQAWDETVTKHAYRSCHSGLIRVPQPGTGGGKQARQETDVAGAADGFQAGGVRKARRAVLEG